MLRKALWLGAVAIGALIAMESAILERMWFQFYRADYLSTIGTRDLALFAWSEYGSLGGAVSFKGVLFDRSDGIALPINERTLQWTAHFLKECSTSVVCGIVEKSPDWCSSTITLGEHFYLLRLKDC
jgi:hypothetical protein